MNKPQVAHMADASSLWAALRISPVDASAWRALAAWYLEKGLPWQAEYALRQARRLADESDDNGVEEDALLISLHDTRGERLLGRAELAEADILAIRFETLLAKYPGDWLTSLYAARLKEISGDDDEARRLLERSCELEVIEGESMHWMGVWRLRAGDASGAVTALSTLLDIRPVRYGSMMVLGEALISVGNFEAAEKAFSRASMSGNPALLKTLASRAFGANYWREAIAVLNKAVAFDPCDVAAWLALAEIQSQTYQLEDCRQSLNRIQTLAPNNAAAAVLAAGLPGRVGDARASFSSLLALYETSGDPLSRLPSSIAMTSLYHDELTAEEKAELHQRMCAPISEKLGVAAAIPLTYTGKRRIRLGYVGGDMHRQHPVNLLLLPVLAEHDHDAFEVCFYYTGNMHDAYTTQARSCCDRWQEVGGMSDSELCALIRKDEVDVLIDLAGHTATHRLGVFAMRAAPIQVSFMGYPHSTGLRGMDWLIGDPIVAPESHEGLFSEKIARLPDSVFCWTPMDHYEIPSPRSDDLPVVFGSFNNAIKISQRTIALWSKVLLEVPGSTLLLKAPSLGNDFVCSHFTSLFDQHGIKPERLVFRGPSELSAMMAEYADIDLALDPLPYNGGMTSLQALWMGVPFVTLLGDNFAGRMGASFLQSLGRSELVASDERGYVDIARGLAEEKVRWRQSRHKLREQMRNSPLSDSKRYAHHLENLIRNLVVIRD